MVAYLVEVEARAMMRSNGARQSRADEEEIAPSVVQVVREVLSRHGTLRATGACGAHETCRRLEHGSVTIAAVVDDRRVRRWTHDDAS